MLTPVDTLIEARWVIPVAPELEGPQSVLSDHAVALDGGKIAALGPSAALRERYAPREHVVLADHALIPGLVNAHCHAAMTLLRGFADDLPLMRWLQERIWPAELKHVGPEFVYDGSLAAAQEMLLGGITCVNDMYFYPDSSAQAFVDAGLRSAVGIIAIEFPSRYASDPDDYLAKGLATRDRFRDESLITFCLAPHAPYTASDRTFRRIVTIAEELDVPIHTHLHETRHETEQSVTEHGLRPLARLHALGAVSPRLMAVHAVHLGDREIAQLAACGASVVHCPTSNMKLASGIAPTHELLNQGVNLALGTDGAASNNRLDLFAEMRTAALLAKVASGDASAFPASAVLRAATLGGAQALGLEAVCGSIQVGKWADLTAVSFSSPGLQPCYDPVSHLVYACGREDVTDVWVAGQRRVSDRRTVGRRFDELATRICMWQNKLVI